MCESRREAVKKYTPETECKKVPRQLCGPSGCVPEAGPEECFDRKSTIVVEVRPPSPPGIGDFLCRLFIGNSALFFHPVGFETGNFDLSLYVNTSICVQITTNCVAHILMRLTRLSCEGVVSLVCSWRSVKL